MRRQRHDRLPRVSDDDGAQDEGHGQRGGAEGRLQGVRQGRQRLHHVRRTTSRDDEPRGAADGRGGGRDDPGGGHRRRRTNQLRRCVRRGSFGS